MIPIPKTIRKTDLNHFYDLRNCELEPSLALKLAPFLIANRPYDLGPDQTWRELRDNEPAEHVSVGVDEMTEDLSVFDSITFDTDRDDVAFVTRPDIQSNWLEARISHWKTLTGSR